MIMERFESNTSKIVEWLRFPMAVLVVFIHLTPHLNANFTPISKIEWSNISYNNIYSLIGVFVNNIATVAVPFFFFTAGYYFFYHVDAFNYNIFKQKLQKRINTLLIPYLLWNFLTILFRFSHGLWQKYVLHVHLTEKHSLSFDDICNIPNYAGYMWNYFTVYDKSSLDILGLSSSFSAPIDLPLWFLRDLIVLSLLSPLIYLAVRHLKAAFLAILCVAYIFNLETLPGINVVGLFFFSFGSYIAIKGNNILSCFYKYRWFAWMLTPLLLTSLLLMDETSEWVIVNHIYCIIAIITVVTIANIYLKRVDVTNGLFMKYSHAAFFIYALHTIPLIITSTLGFGTYFTNKVIDIFLPTSFDGGMIISYLVAPFIAVGICLLFYNLLNRFFPKTLFWLVGGRI